MDGGEDQLDRPFRRKPFGFQRIGQTKPTNGQIGAGCADTVKLQIHILTFGQNRAFLQQFQFRGQQFAVQIGGSNLDRCHATFAGQEARKRDFQLAVGEEKDRLAVQILRLCGNGLAGAGAGGCGDGLENLGRDAEFGCDGLQPGRCALFAKGEGGGQALRAPPHQGGMGIAQKRLGQRNNGIGANGWQIRASAGRQAAHRANAHRGQKCQRLILHHIRQRADHQQFFRLGLRQTGHHRSKTGIFALRKRRLDPGAGVVQHPHMRRMFRRKPFGRAGQIQLDHLGRAGADQKQLADIGSAGQQPGNLAVDFCLGIGKPGKILFLKDGGAEARLCKDHYACSRLQKMGAGPRPNHQKERVLHFAVQPDDSRQPAEHLALAAFLENGRVGASPRGHG